MKCLTNKTRALLGALSLTCIATATPATAAGLLTPAGSNSPLAIRDHDVRVVVDDGYVVTEVEQVFVNPSGQDFEAVYSFPVPEGGAVAEFTYWIDGKPVTGEVLPRERAREVYEREKAAGRETAIAEKDEYRTFDISVYPVRAGQDVRTRLVYLQTAHTDTGIGRYAYPLEEGGVDEERKAFWEILDEVTGSFGFELELKSSYPVDAIRVPGQPGAVTTRIDSGHWKVTLGSVGTNTGGNFDAQVEAIEGAEIPATTTIPAATPAGAAKLDADVVVYWRHQPGLPGSVDLVTHKPDPSGRGTFMLTLTPGDDLPAITAGRDWLFVLDRSGSMAGKFATLADGVERALQTLNPQDRFRIVAFNNGSRELTSGFTPATADQVQHYVREVAQLSAEGGTNLHAGLSQGLRALDDDRSSGVVLVTDGVANVGVTDKKDFLELMRQHDVRLYTFIMGNSANRPLLEAMTEVSNGFAMSTSNSDDIAGQMIQATGKLSHHAMHGVELDIRGIKTADVRPADIRSLYHGEQLVVLGHYWGGDEAEVTLRAEVAGHPVEYSTRFGFPAQSDLNPELERIWAYRTIEALQAQMDYLGADADTEDAITDLAVEYGLVTDYTSMLVVREEVFEALGIARTNRDRVAAERRARDVRAQRPPANRRVDQQAPMYSSPRPSTGGSGATGIVEAVAMLMVAAFVRGRRRRTVAVTC